MKVVVPRGRWEEVHELVVDSTHDAQAHCSCGGWSYVMTGVSSEREMGSEFLKHAIGPMKEKGK